MKPGRKFFSRPIFTSRIRSDPVMIRFLSGNRITLLRNGTEYFPALEQAIDEARSQIFLETYIYEPDQIGPGHDPLSFRQPHHPAAQRHGILPRAGTGDR